jgi:2-iminobutanoate/2-iminopropanoate deaminase
VTESLVFIAGQRPVDPDTGETPNGFRAQAEQALKNVKAVLASADSELSDVAKVNVYLADLTNFNELNEVYVEWFSEPYPARTTIGSALRGGILLEIDVVALRNAPTTE